MAQPSDHDPDMRAAEYVLGTLPTDEAARVERELEHDRALQSEVAFWEEQLGQLGLLLTPVDPPTEVWQAIHARLDEPRPNRAPDEHSAHHTPARRSPRLWQGLAVAASIAALVLAGLLYVGANRPAQSPTPTYASIFYDQPTSTGWMLTASADTGEMSVTAVGDYPLPTDKELRLWIIPKGGKPIASGIVPAEGKHSWPMTTRVAKLMHQPGTTIAVTMEVAGESVTDGAEGPLMWKALVRQRG